MFSIILPAYNERKNLEKCVKETMKILKKMNVRYEVIIAEDGSTDGTDKIAARLANKYKNVRHIHNDTKLGRGRALKNAFSFAKGSSIGYMDVDMATDLAYIKELVSYSAKYDVTTGSRYLSSSATERPLTRDLVSRSYNWIGRIFLGSGIYDLQCGFKSFSKKFVEKEIPRINERSWAWDTVVLVVARKMGYSIKEFPVRWVEKKSRSHSASPKRILSDIKIHGKVLIKLFAKFNLGLDVSV